jgi:phage FluMu gp28-like protein
MADWQRTPGDRFDGRLFAGVDIGRKKDLTVLWVFELLGDVLYTRCVLALENMRKSEQEKHLWPWFEVCERVCIDATGLGIGWADDAQDVFGASRVEAVNFSAAIKEALAYPLKGAMEDRKLRIPIDPKITADLRKVQKVTTAAGNIRFVAESTPDGHADRFWALALALHAASSPAAPIEFISGGARESHRAFGDFIHGY